VEIRLLLILWPLARTTVRTTAQTVMAILPIERAVALCWQIYAELTDTWRARGRAGALHVEYEMRRLIAAEFKAAERPGS